MEATICGKTIEITGRVQEKRPGMPDLMRFTPRADALAAWQSVFPAAPEPSPPVPCNFSWGGHPGVIAIGDGLRFKMQASSEASSWSRAFPNPLPDTQRLVYRWSGGTVELWVEHKPELAKHTFQVIPAGPVAVNVIPPSPLPPPLETLIQTPPETPPSLPVSAESPPEALLAPVESPPPLAELKALEALKQGELITIGAEEGLTLTKSQSRTAMAAAIFKKRQEKAAL